jgi:hypothetical protein
MPLAFIEEVNRCFYGKLNLSWTGGTTARAIARCDPAAPANRPRHDHARPIVIGAQRLLR